MTDAMHGRPSGPRNTRRSALIPGSMRKVRNVVLLSGQLPNIRSRAWARGSALWRRGLRSIPGRKV